MGDQDIAVFWTAVLSIIAITVTVFFLIRFFQAVEYLKRLAAQSEIQTRLLQQLTHGDSASAASLSAPVSDDPLIGLELR